MAHIVDNPDRRWPLATVPFRIATGSWPTEADEITASANITAAIAQWETNTPICFVERNGEVDFVEFSGIATPLPPGRCWSITDTIIPAPAIGRMGGRQFIGCRTTAGFGSFVHEIGHAVGFFHEHQRSDRDGNVSVGIGDPWNFGIPGDGLNVGNYDCGSAMHYQPDGIILTLEDGDACSAGVGSNALSAGDIAGADQMYLDASLSFRRVVRGCMNEQGTVSLRDLLAVPDTPGASRSYRRALLRLENEHCPHS